MNRAIQWLIDQRLGLLLGLVVLLNGCFQSDLTLRFDHSTHGQMTQSIDLGQRGLALVSATLDPWLEGLHQPVQRLGGRLSQTAESIRLTVPFSTGPDLVARFNQVFVEADSPGPTPSPTLNADFQRLVVPGLGAIPFRLRVDQQNWGLVSRTHLVYELDLREFRGLDAIADPQSPPSQGFPLSFSLQTPWGLQPVRPGSLPPDTLRPTTARWILELGQLNVIDVQFWLPNAVGLGSFGIVVVVLLGYILRYRVLKPPGRSS
jgi:hypothetical protein